MLISWAPLFFHQIVYFKSSCPTGLLYRPSLVWKLYLIEFAKNCFLRKYNSQSCFLVQFNSVAHLCPTLCDPMNCSTPGLSVHHQLPEFTQTHVHWVGVVIQPSVSSSPSPPTFNLSQHQGLFRWVSSSHQLAKVLEFPLQHQSLEWIFRTYLL